MWSSYHQVPRVQCVHPRSYCTSQYDCRPPVLNTDKGGRLLRLFDSEPHGKQSINNSLFYDTLIPIAAHYGSSDPPKLVFMSDFTNCGPYIAVARICTCGERSLAILGKQWELHEEMECANAGNGRSDWSDMYIG